MSSDLSLDDSDHVDLLETSMKITFGVYFYVL